MPIPKLSNVSSPFGAPMGRRCFKADNDDQRFYLQQLNLVDGDYDEGGAYWGKGDSPLYRYFSEDGEGEGFCRAKNRAEAKEQIREIYPKARFFK